MKKNKFVQKIYLNNFRVKYLLLGVTLFSRRIEKRVKIPKIEERLPRIYLNIGSLENHDKRSGIPRVIKSLLYAGLEGINQNIFPVYPDVQQGSYRIALSYLKKQGLKIPYSMEDVDEDIEVSVSKGDCFIHMEVNPNELEYMDGYFEYFRSKGGLVGGFAYDILAISNPEWFRQRDSIKLRMWYSKILIYDFIITISDSTKKSLKEWIRHEKIRYHPIIKTIKLGANFYEQVAECEVKEIPQELRNKEYVLHVSTIEPRKGHAEVLESIEEAWKSGSNLCYVIVGKRGWKVWRLIFKILTHKEYKKKLFWYNNVEDCQLKSFYENSRAVVVASLGEGFGLPLIEGTMFGKVIFARDISVFREIAPEGIIFFSPKGAKNSLANIFNKIEDFPKKQKYPTNSFYWWKTWEQLADFLDGMNFKKDNQGL